MKNAANILRTKPDSSVHTIDIEATVFEAVKRMAEKNVGALVVLENGRVAGMVSERDYARKVALLDRTSKSTPLRDIMSSPVRFVLPESTGERCMALMTEHHLRHLPVMDGDQLVGLISIGDLVKDLVSEQQFVIEQLENYISGQNG